MEPEIPFLSYRILDRVGNNFLWSGIYARFVDDLRLGGTERVLDFGSGSGAGARQVAARLPSGCLVCVDISSYWMDVCRKRLARYPRTEFRLGFLPDLGLPAASFDVIAVHYALHEVREEDRPAVVAALAGLLKDDGRLCIKEPQRKGDGMPVETIRSLLSCACLTERASRTGRDWFWAEYRK